MPRAATATGSVGKYGGPKSKPLSRIIINHLKTISEARFSFVYKI